MPKSIVGLFESQSEAQAAERALEQAGFNRNNVVVVSQPSAQLDNSLVQAGVHEQDAQLFSQSVQGGGALVVAQAIGDEEAERAASIVDRHNVVDISRRAPSSYQRVSLDRGSTDANAYSNIYHGNEIVIPIIQEELIVGKQEVERGGVRVNVGVEEVPVQEQVTLREENVQVQRRPVNRPVSDADMAALQSGPIEVRETAEQAVVSKEARVVEEVTVAKDVEEHTETIRDTVRRVEVDVEQAPGSTNVRSVNDTTDDRQV